MLHEHKNARIFVSMFNGHPRNQKFIQHFERLKNDAIQSNNLNLSRGYTQVVISLRKFPLPITSITHAETLQGVGSSYLSEFHSLLDSSGDDVGCERWKAEYRSCVEQFALERGGFPVWADASSDDLNVAPRQKEQRSAHYSPPIGSSAWACTIILHARGGDVSFSDIYSSMEDFKVKYPKTSKFNEKVLSKLVKRGLIDVFDDNGASYARLTAEGQVLSESIWHKSLRSENLSTLLSLDQYVATPFELIMLVDNREFAIANALEVMRPDIRTEQRTLPVGDVVWVWRRDKSDEVMSGFAVERKTIADLSMSIKDGRWEEQRRRLARSPGITSVVYIIEGDYDESVSRCHHGGLLPKQSIQTAMTQTELVPGFSLVTTKNVSETTQALLDMHVKILTSPGCFLEEDVSDTWTTYRDFLGDIHKTNALTVAQVTSKILRAIPGVGAEAVVGINDFLGKSGMSGLTLANVAKILRDPSLCETIKKVTGAKRAPLTAPALAALREQYLANNFNQS